MKLMITHVGHKNIKVRLERLRIERNSLINEMNEVQKNCLSSDDSSELNQYRMSLDAIEENIRNMQDALDNSKIIDVSSINTDVVRFGHKVTVEDLDTEEVFIVNLVSIYESEPKNGFVSIQSPLGKALCGAAKGDSVDFSTPKGVRELEILSIDIMDEMPVTNSSE